jgi:hypothetical protein
LASSLLVASDAPMHPIDSAVPMRVAGAIKALITGPLMPTEPRSIAWGQVPRGSSSGHE